MPQVIITVGIPASGKTTWANEYIDAHQNTTITCRDDIRAYFNLPYGDPKVEQYITDCQRGHIKFAIENAHTDIIVADTNIVERFREDLIDFCLDLKDVTVQIKTFPCCLEIAVMRDALQERPVGYEVITRMSRMLDSSDRVRDCVITKDRTVTPL